MNRRLAAALLLLLVMMCAAGADPLPPGAAPPVHVMYLDSPKESKFSVLVKREFYPWPLMRIGFRSSGEHGFGLVRFFVASGARRADLLRQCRRAALLAFRTFPGLHTLDLDAAPSDDNDQVKASPWFAATLERDRALKLSLDTTPEAWFQAQGPLTLHAELVKDRDATAAVLDELLLEWRKPLPVKPKKIKKVSPKPVNPGRAPAASR